MKEFLIIFISRASSPDLLGVQEVEGHQWETAGAIGRIIHMYLHTHMNTDAT